MLSVDEALAAIVREVDVGPPVDLSLNDAVGLVLAGDLTSHVDSPPFDKSQMDGFAVRAADVAHGRAALEIVEEITAGNVPQRSISPGQAARIMTGAPIPEGADAVVPIEKTEFAEGQTSVTIKEPVPLGAFIIRRGASMAFGETVVSAGTRLLAPQLGLLGELGRGTVCVRSRPLVGVLATGDELVPVDERPGEGQIRNSNQTMLVAQVRQAGASGWPLGIARDKREHLKSKIAAGLKCDVLCLSGGVSAGKLDLVPSELQSAGVREVFHKVQIKPGKPVWFGVLDGGSTADGRPRYVFGLPGNPVSSMVCFELFVRTALRRLMGINPAQPIMARLQVEHGARGDRPTYFPARLQWTDDGLAVRPVDWRGSFDLRATAEANAMILFPAGERTYAAGEMVPVYEWSCGS